MHHFSNVQAQSILLLLSLLQIEKFIIYYSFRFYFLKFIRLVVMQPKSHTGSIPSYATNSTSGSQACFKIKNRKIKQIKIARRSPN